MGSPLRVHFNALLASTGLQMPSPPLECNSLAAARAFLLESDRVMLLSAHQIHYEMQAGLLVALPHPAGNVVRPIGLTLRRDWRPTSTQQRLLEILRRSARDAAAGTSPAVQRRGSARPATDSGALSPGRLARRGVDSPFSAAQQPPRACRSPNHAREIERDLHLEAAVHVVQAPLDEMLAVVA